MYENVFNRIFYRKLYVRSKFSCVRSFHDLCARSCTRAQLRAKLEWTFPETQLSRDLNVGLPKCSVPKRRDPMGFRWSMDPDGFSVIVRRAINVILLDISASGSVWPKYICYFDLDWSNRYVVRTCSVSGQWLLSAYKVLVAQLSGSV